MTPYWILDRVPGRISEVTSCPQLTIGEVDVFGDLVPRAVVEVADLLLVLHHVGRLASFFILHGDVVLDCLEILPMLQICDIVGVRRVYTLYYVAHTVRKGSILHLVEPFKEAVLVLCAPGLPLPTGPLLVTSLLLLLSRPLALGGLGYATCGACHRPRLSQGPLGGGAILCACVTPKATLVGTKNHHNDSVSL